MTEACQMPTPAERQYGEIQTRIELELTQKVYAAIHEAKTQALAEIQAAGLEMPAPTSDYFGARIHQSLYCTLCAADPKTFAGGRPEIAVAIIRNSQNIAKHYWGADIEPHART